MFFSLILSTVAASIIATAIMVLFLYLPLLWGGNYYDVLGGLGSAITKKLDGRARFIGTLVYFSGGLLFGLLYGWIVLAFMTSNLQVPSLPFMSLGNIEIDLFYPIIGLAIGLGHGLMIALIVAVVVVEHHPLERYRSRLILAISQVISHVAYGAAIMFFHHQFLQLLIS